MANHSQVAHRWAQDYLAGRTVSGFNMFYETRPAYRELFAEGSQEHVIFSHGRHFPIAAFQTTPRGERVVLFTSKDYSVSTSKHKSHVARAIPSRVRTFRVPDVSPAHKSGGAEHFHRDNLDALLKEAAEANGKAKRARKYGAYHTEDATKALRMAADYAEAFGIEWQSPDLETLTAELQRREAEAAAQYAQERREREQRERERMAKLKADQAEDFAAWLSGAPMRFVPSAYSVDDNGNAYVRRAGDNLETSQGASVPWEHAVKAFRFIALCRATGKAWKRNGHVVRVGHYQVDSIDAEGNMRAGCHSFAWEHMKACAEREGVNVEPSAEAVESRS